MRTILAIFLVFLVVGLRGQDLQSFFDPGELSRANTALDVDYLSQEEKDIYLYSNLARMVPKKFNQFYRAYVKVRRTNWKEMLERNPYFSSLSSHLLKQTPLPALFPDRELFELAKCWAAESGKLGITGHDRVNCPDVGRENCSYGYSKGIDIALQLLIDDGVESLGHRTNILSNSKGLGASIQPHTRYGSCAVLDFWGTNDRIKQIRGERQALFPSLMSKWTPVEIEQIDQNKSLGFLNEKEKEYYRYVNMIRLFPKKFKELFWDNGPYFDKDLSEQRESLSNDQTYLQVSSKLESLGPSESLIAKETTIQAGRCVAKAMNAKNSFSLTGVNCNTGQMQASTYVPDDVYEFIIDQLLDGKFNDVFYQNRILIMNQGDNFNVLITLYQSN